MLLEEFLCCVRARTEARTQAHELSRFGVAGERSAGRHANVRAANGDIAIRGVAANANAVGASTCVKACCRVLPGHSVLTAATAVMNRLVRRADSLRCVPRVEQSLTFPAPAPVSL